MSGPEQYLDDTKDLYLEQCLVDTMDLHLKWSGARFDSGLEQCVACRRPDWAVLQPKRHVMVVAIVLELCGADH